MQVLGLMAPISQDELSAAGIPGTFVADLQRFPTI
jgi:hypothetical protein